MRRTKIVATLGPATSTPEQIGRLITAGMDVARLNFSHGTQKDHGRSIAMVRAAAEQAGHDTLIIVKIEKPQALDDLEGILKVVALTPYEHICRRLSRPDACAASSSCRSAGSGTGPTQRRGRTSRAWFSPGERPQEPQHRWREVLRHIGLGQSNDELAEQLFISPATARAYARAAWSRPASPDRQHEGRRGLGPV